MPDLDNRRRLDGPAATPPSRRLARRALGLLVAGLPLLMAGAPTPATPLTAAQQREIARAFVCPAALPDDAARIAALDRFIKRYAELVPASRPAEQLAFHAALRQRHKCAAMDHDLIHTAPEL